MITCLTIWGGSPRIDTIAYREQFGETQGLLDIPHRSRLLQELSGLSIEHYVRPVDLVDFPVHEEMYRLQTQAVK